MSNSPMKKAFGFTGISDDLTERQQFLEPGNDIASLERELLVIARVDWVAFDPRIT